MAVLSQSKSGASGAWAESVKRFQVEMELKRKHSGSTVPKKIFEGKPQLINLSGDETNLLKTSASRVETKRCLSL